MGCIVGLTVEAARLDALVHGCGRCDRLDVTVWRFVDEGDDKLTAICSACVRADDLLLRVG